MNPSPGNPATGSPPMAGAPPVHPAPVSYSVMGALRGPLLLTTLGVLLTIDYGGGMTFGRTWPVLLIVFGLCKLAEYAGPRSGRL